MERPPNRKRQCSDESSESSHPTKRAKSTCEHNFSPAFWDRLSKVPLTRRALRELDRRNTDIPRQHQIPQIRHSNLYRFARHGGPDLCYLRGYPEPESISYNMSSSRSSTGRSRQTQSTKATTVTNKTRKSSAYGKDFEQHLTDYGIYGANHDYRDVSTPEPENLYLTQQLLIAERASLSPSQFPQSAFREFKQKNARATFESDVIANVVPAICGISNIPNQQNVLFTELTPIADEDTVKPKPDFFDGARLDDLSQAIRNDQNLRSTVIPTKHASVPVAPNFYMEVKGPDGSAAVAQRQACYDGAHGARTMHALQTYGDADPKYDGNAYTYSSTYHDGQLKLFAHHSTAPTTPDGRPEYHMTQIDSYGMTGNINSFRRGATAFRNARDIAQRHRTSFIETANARASQASSGDVTEREIERLSHGPDSLEYANYSAWQDADDALQQHIAETSKYNADTDDDTPDDSIPQHLYTEDDSQGLTHGSITLNADNPSMSFTSSFTSFSTEIVHSKPQREPAS